MPSLPHEIITDILSRQPVKSLLRFRSVSKPWCSLIDDPNFVKLHLNQSKSNPSDNLFIVGDGGEGNLYSLDYDVLADSVRKIETPFFSNCSSIEIVSSCNGLLLLQNNDTCVLCLLNPLTRKFLLLPSAPIDYPMGPEVGSSFEACGLAYDSKNDDYKIVRVVEFSKRNSDDWISSETRVFSLKSSSWKRVEDFHYRIPRKRVWGAQVNGVFHSIVKTPMGKMIGGFNVCTETFTKVVFPEFWDLKSVTITTEVLDGCLCLVGVYPGYRRDIWVMKEYEVRDSWVKLASIAPPFVDLYFSLLPITYSESRNEILLNCNNDSLIWYDVNRKSVRVVSGLPSLIYAEVCLGSLVPVRGSGEASGSGSVVKKLKEKKNKKRDDFLSKGFKLAL